MLEKRIFTGLVVASMNVFATAAFSADALHVDANGRVGFGIDAPQAPLHVLQTTGNAGEMLRFENNGGSYITFENSARGETWWFVHENAQVVADGPRFLITHSTHSGPSMSLSPDGNLVIGGSLTTATQTIPDYVFEQDYPLMPIEELAKFIEKEKHLPKIASNADVQKTGQLNMTELQIQLLEKVEELVLYTIDQERQLTELRQEKIALKTTVEKLHQRLERLEQ